MDNINHINDFKITYVDTVIKDDQPVEHYHNAYELVYFIKADLRMFIKDKCYHIEDGDLMFVNEFVIHKMVYHSGTHYTRYVINFKRDFLYEVMRAMKVECLMDNIESKCYKSVGIHIKEKGEIEKLYRTIFENSKKLAQGQNVVEAIIKSSMVILLTYYHHLMNSSPPARELEKTSQQVKNIIQYIDSHYAQTISLDLLQDIFFLNKYHIAHIFKRVTGFSIVEYIQYRRVIEAQKMLRNTNKEITDICYDCGFNNIQHFCRVFKKITCTTPLQYRRPT